MAPAPATHSGLAHTLWSHCWYWSVPSQGSKLRDSLNQYTGGTGSDRAELLEVMDGADLVDDRKGGGASKSNGSTASAAAAKKETKAAENAGDAYAERFEAWRSLRGAA